MANLFQGVFRNFILSPKPKAVIFKSLHKTLFSRGSYYWVNSQFKTYLLHKGSAQLLMNKSKSTHK